MFRQIEMCFHVKPRTSGEFTKICQERCKQSILIGFQQLVSKSVIRMQKGNIAARIWK